MKIVSVAPMVDVTTRHFNRLIRLLSKRTTLYTPMIAAQKLTNRKRANELLRFHDEERQGGGLVAQLGGADPDHILRAAERVQAHGYSELNINLGCPAKNAQSFEYGAALMKPHRHENVVAMLSRLTTELTIPVSVKLRIGVDTHDSYEFFRDFVDLLSTEAGVSRFVVHSRKALLGKGKSWVSTRQNRMDEIVPLRYDRVHRLKTELPHLRIEINGGIKTIEDVRSHLIGSGNAPGTAETAPLDGVMLGRKARDDPFFFSAVDPLVFGDIDAFARMTTLQARCSVLRQYADYVLEEQSSGRERSREMLLKPTNQIFEGCGSNVKKRWGHLMRSTPARDRPVLFGDEMLFALEALLQEGNIAKGNTATRRITMGWRERRTAQMRRSSSSRNERNVPNMAFVDISSSNSTNNEGKKKKKKKKKYSKYAA